jgi:hypothetical protein
LDAYNANDVEAFCVIYAPDATLHRLGGPEAVFLSGRPDIRTRYAGFFARSAPRSELIARQEVGPFVIDHKRVSLKDGTTFEATAVYLVVDGQIQTVWFADPRALAETLASGTAATGAGTPKA